MVVAAGVTFPMGQIADVLPARLHAPPWSLPPHRARAVGELVLAPEPADPTVPHTLVAASAA